MHRRSPILRFFVAFAVVYGALIAPWPGWDRLYSRYFRILGGTFLAANNDKRIVRFEEATASASLDTQIVLANPHLRNGSGRMPARILALDSRGVGWIPTTLTMALILATPVAWRRRLWAFVLGLFAVHVFILLTIEIYIWNESDVASGLALVTLTPVWKAIVDGLEETFVTQLGASIVVPVIIWFVVTFKRQDFVAISNLFDRRPAPKTSRSEFYKEAKFKSD